MKAAELGKHFNSYLKTGKTKTLKILAVRGLKVIATNFEKEGRPEKWKKSIKSKKNKGTKTLVIKGNLKRVSSSIDAATSSVSITTNPIARPYARLMNDGGEVKAKARKQKYQEKTTATGRKLDVFVKNSRKRFTGEKNLSAHVKKYVGRKFMVIPDEEAPNFVKDVREGFKGV